jgi:hypothetical protein
MGAHHSSPSFVGAKAVVGPGINMLENVTLLIKRRMTDGQLDNEGALFNGCPSLKPIF